MFDPRITALRLQLAAQGYRPVPVLGKRPIMQGWRTACASADAATIERWAITEPRCVSTGLLCGELIGADVDVPLPDLAAQIETEIQFYLGCTPLRRVGSAPKSMLAYRATEPFAKVSTGEYFLADNTKLCVEFLADGQQFVAQGIHPDTGRPYAWTDAKPTIVPLRDLLAVSLGDVLELRERLRAVFVAAGAVRKTGSGVGLGRPLACTDAPGLAGLADGLGWVSNEDRSYDSWIEIGMALYSAAGEAGLPLWLEWSGRSWKDNADYTESKWPTFAGVHSITVRTIWAEAEAAGWKGRPDRVPPSADFSPVPVPLGHTDEALALHFADSHADRLRYVAAWGKWLWWDGRRWATDDTRLATDLVRACIRDVVAESEGLKPREKAAIESAKTVAAVERLATTDRRLARSADVWDRDPWLLNCPDGVLDLRTGRVSAHDASLHMTKMSAVSPSGACPIFEEFLRRVCDGDAELIAFLQRVAGYALTGLTREHAMFFFYGQGANGKSVLLSTLGGLMGDYAATAPMETFIASSHDRHPTEIAGLRGARLVTAIETEEGRRWAEAKISALTGGDKIAARFMRQDFFEFVPEFKLVVAGNHRPSLRGVGEAIARRMNLVPFRVTIPPEERDKDLTEKLRAEWPGVMAWAARGCLAWQRSGLAAPAAVAEATAQYLTAEDAFGQWLEESCILDRLSVTSSASLYANWQDWAKRAGEAPGVRKVFAHRFELRTQIHSSHTRVGEVFRGVKLRTAFDDAGEAEEGGEDVLAGQAALSHSEKPLLN